MGSVPHRTWQASLLLVEDDREAREFLSSALTRRFPGIRLEVADDGAVGLEMYRRIVPDIVITDINMPVMDGIRMSAEIKALEPETVIIVLTAFSDTHYLMDAIGVGVNHYVMKPVDYGKLFAALEKSFDVLSLRRQVQEMNAALALRTNQLETANLDLVAFNYSVTHDLRTPLAAIDIYRELLGERCGDKLDEECRSFLAAIGKLTQQMNHLIESLLKLSHLSHCELGLQTVDLSGIAVEVARGLQMTEPNRRVEFRITEGVSVQGDTKLLRVALENLLGNAWKFTGRRKKPLIEFGATHIAGVPAYFVRDNGAGFDMGEANRLFVAFQRLHGVDEFAGTGIGLATVQRIIQRHGGRVWAEGKIGRGASFFFTLKE